MHLFKTYFTSTQVSLLILAFVAILLGAYFQGKNKNLPAIGLLFFASLLVFGFAALLDPFLNLWDERFHALVAKNMMNNPFKPMLYADPVVDMEYQPWDRYHIWLHKQPLFLWQMALSFKLFGVNEFALRIPSILLASLMVVAAYRSGKVLVNENVGFYSAVFLISSVYFIRLVAGRQELDHNDLSFVAYISLSIWSFIEYRHDRQKKWILLIGLFSGMAILVKWVVGLLVYLGWFVVLLLDKKRVSLPDLRSPLVALGVTLAIALPWQIYIFLRFPGAAQAAYALNIEHATIPLDGHTGGMGYHFLMLNTMYGFYALYLLLPAMYILWRRMDDKQLYFGLISMVVVVYAFFSFVQTKMPSFTLVVALILVVLFASLLDKLLGWLNARSKYKAGRIIELLVGTTLILTLNFNVEYLQAKHTSWKNDYYFLQQVHNTNQLKSLDLPDHAVIFNTRGRQYIECMFYTGFPAYDFIPTVDQVNKLKQEGRKIILFNSFDTDLPAYIQTDSSILKPDVRLFRMD